MHSEHITWSVDYMQSWMPKIAKSSAQGLLRVFLFALYYRLTSRVPKVVSNQVSQEFVMKIESKLPEKLTGEKLINVLTCKKTRSKWDKDVKSVYLGPDYLYLLYDDNSDEICKFEHFKESDSFYIVETIKL